MTAPASDPSPNNGTLALWRELLRGGNLPRFVVLCLGVWLHAADTLMVATLMPSAVVEIGGAPWLGWTMALHEGGSGAGGAATGLLGVRVLGLEMGLLGEA